MSLDGRIAGAPITWGVCEVPGWGKQLDPARVLDDMRRIGMAATEAGPEGFLPSDAPAMRAVLETYGLRLAAAFVPVVLHDESRQLQELNHFKERATLLAHAGADVVVVAASTGIDGYDDPHPSGILDASGWSRLTLGLDTVAQVAADLGLRAALHPHVGTMVERADDVRRVIDECGIGLCLDTGHLIIGGVEPFDIVARHPSRVAHVHMKDVNKAIAGRVRDGQLAYAEAVAAGMYVPLGHGEVQAAKLVAALEESGYDGWYVLEQDVRLHDESVDPASDAATSLHELRVAATLASSTRGTQ